jgi:SET domain-containing protein
MKLSKKQFLRSLKNVYCRLAPTKNGVGVVAIRAISKGTDPFAQCDPFGDVLQIPKAELDSANAPEEAKEMVRDFCALQDGMYFVPDYGIDAIDKSYFLNHAKKPNLITKDKGETFIAARNIKKGEELTANYDYYQELRKKFRK